MKRIVLMLAAVSLLAGLATSYAVHKTMPAESVVPLPGPYAETVYRYITVEDPYGDWQVWPGKGKKIKGRAPLDYITTYVNDNALYSIIAGKTMANGSLIVTENYSPADKKLSALFVMYKIKKYNPGEGDWFWAQYDSHGKKITAGKVSDCIECHTKVKDNDYVFTENFVK
jgi:hypothetical protein